MDSHSGVKPPDLPLQTQEQAESASQTVTHIPIELIFFPVTPNQPQLPLHQPVFHGWWRGVACYLMLGPDVTCHLRCTLAP